MTALDIVTIVASPAFARSNIVLRSASNTMASVSSSTPESSSAASALHSPPQASAMASNGSQLWAGRLVLSPVGLVEFAFVR